MKHDINEQIFKDPVCGMEVSYKTATGETSYGTKLFYFCSPDCQLAFETEPEKFLKHHRQHGIRPK